jgi:hypothetical protein
LTEIEELNKYLKSQGISITGQTMYRLVWSESIFEYRRGLFRDFTKSGLFIREAVETRRVRKYNYIKERFILEKWAPGNLTNNPELPDSMNGDYLPIYVFEDKHGNYLPPNRKVLDFILDFMHGRINKDAEIDPKVLEEKEIKYTMESFEDAPDFKTSGEIRNAIAYTRGLKGVKDFKEVRT